MGYVLSERDARRIHDMLRWWEYNKYLRPLRKRQVLPAGGGAAAESPIYWCKVLRGLAYEDLEQQFQGYSQYVCVLIDEGDVFEYNPATEYTAGQRCWKNDENNKPIVYRAKQATTGNQPPNETYWDIEPELNPKAIGIPPETDLRGAIPWFDADTPVPLVKRGETYYFAEGLIKTTTTKSIMWNQTEKRAMGVFF